MAGILGDLIVRVGASIEGFETAMGTVSQKLAAVDRDAKKAGAGFDRIGSTLTGIGMTMTGAVTLPIAVAAGAAVKFAADFDLGMRRVTSLLGDVSQPAFEALRDQTLELAKTLGIDAVKASEALYEALSAGIPKENALEFVRVSSIASIAGLTDTRVAVNALTTMIAAYGMETSEAKELSDAMFQAVNIGKFQFGDLAAAIGPAAQQASALGVSYQELLGATATLSISAGGAGVAVTQIESAMRALLNPTKEMEQAFVKIGVASGSAAVKTFGLEGTLEKLRQSTGGNLEAFNALFGRIEGSIGALGLTGDKAAQAAKDLDSMKHASDGLGAATTAYNEINKSTTRQFEILINQLKATAIELGTALLPTVNQLLQASKPLVGVLADMATWFSNLSPATQTWAIALVAGVAALGPLIGGIGLLTRSVGGLMTTWQLMHKGFVLLANTLTTTVVPAVTETVMFGLTPMTRVITEATTTTISLRAALWSLLAPLAAIGAAAGVVALAFQMERLKDAMGGLRGEVPTLEKNIGALGQRIVSASDAQKQLIDRVAATGPTYDNYAKKLIAAAKAQTDKTVADKAGVAATVATAEAVKTAEEAAKRFTTENDRLKKSAKALRLEHAKQKTELFVLTLATIEGREAGEAYNEWLTTGTTTNAKYADTFQGLNDAFLAMTKAADTSTPNLEVFGATLERLGLTAYQIPDALKAFGAALENIKTISSLEKSAEAARVFYEELVNLKAPIYELTQAWLKVLEAEKAAMSPQGGWTPGMEEALQGVKEDIESLEGVTKKTTEKIPGFYSQLAKEVSTIMTNLAQSIGKNVINLVLGTDRKKFNQDLEDQATDLRSNLEERAAEWERYQADVSASMEKARGDNATALAEELQELETSLADRQSAYDDYAIDTGERAGELREKFADALADELADLEKNLEDRREAYEEFVEDTETNHARNAEDLKENLDDEKRDTERNIADKGTAYRRDTEELRRKIANERALGSKANQERISEWQIELGQKETDYNLYVQRQWEDYNEFASDQQRSYERETTDLNIELGRRADDWAEYQAEIALKRDEAVTDNQAKLAEELADLQKSLADRKAELEAYKIDAATKADELKTTHATKLAEELADLQSSLTSKLAEYDKYKLDTEAKLAEIVEKHRTAWDDVKTFFGTTLTSMGEALTAWVATYLVGGLFAKLGELVTGILPGVGKALTDAFSKTPEVVGGGVDLTAGASDAAKAAAGAASAAGGAAGSAGAAAAAGGAAAWIGAISSAVGAGAAIVGDAILARIHTDTGRIEENTRYSSLYLGGRADQGILGAIFKTNEELGWGVLTKACERIRDEMVLLGAIYINPSLDTMKDLLTDIRDDMRLSLYPQVAAMASGPSVNITIEGNVIGESTFIDRLAAAVMAKLRTQMGG